MDIKLPGSIALRRGRRSIPWQIYSVTTATMGRRAHFADPSSARSAALVLANNSNWPTSIPLLWLVMPDHMHLLIELGADESLSLCVARIKALIAREFSTGNGGRFWQPSFHDHALRRQDNVLHFARYILANPVRAGLAEVPEEWLWRGGELLGAVSEELPWMG